MLQKIAVYFWSEPHILAYPQSTRTKVMLVLTNGINNSVNCKLCGMRNVWYIGEIGWTNKSWPVLAVRAMGCSGSNCSCDKRDELWLLIDGEKACFTYHPRLSSGAESYTTSKRNRKWKKNLSSSYIFQLLLFCVCISVILFVYIYIYIKYINKSMNWIYMIKSKFYE